MKKENVIKSCYSQLRRVTPLNFDCGMLCNGKCCKGDNKTGMIIFPGEENFIDSNMKIYQNEEGDTVAVCDGKCDRNKRPLACRIYPLFPLLKYCEDNKYIEVIFDYRADCPILNTDYEINKSFIKAVKRVGKYLLLNNETKECFEKLSEVQKEYSDFADKLFMNNKK
jgi:hypothetical protein